MRIRKYVLGIKTYTARKTPARGYVLVKLVDLTNRVTRDVYLPRSIKVHGDELEYRDQLWWVMEVQRDSRGKPLVVEIAEYQDGWAH